MRPQPRNLPQFEADFDKFHRSRLDGGRLNAKPACLSKSVRLAAARASFLDQPIYMRLWNWSLGVWTSSRHAPFSVLVQEMILLYFLITASVNSGAGRMERPARFPVTPRQWRTKSPSQKQ